MQYLPTASADVLGRADPGECNSARLSACPSDGRTSPATRRTVGGGFISPSLIDHQVNLAIVIDTSGSMSNKALGEAVKIVAGVIKTLPRRDAVRVMAADAQTYDCQKVFREEQIILTGGGGTDMRQAIVDASELKPRPDIVLCLTDGLTGWPDGPTDHVPCVAIIVSDGDAKSAPAWIDQVVVSESAMNAKPL